MLYWPVAEAASLHELSQDAGGVEGFLTQAPGHEGPCELPQGGLQVLDVCPREEPLHLLLDLCHWCCLQEQLQNVYIFFQMQFQYYESHEKTKFYLDELHNLVIC